MNIYDLLGVSGFIFLSICWIPETIATIKRGYISVKLSFLILYFLGSFFLLLQAIGINNIPLILLNIFTSTSSAINLYFGLNPRKNVV